MQADEAVAIERKAFRAQRTCPKCQHDEFDYHYIEEGEYNKPPGSMQEAMQAFTGRGQQETFTYPECLVLVCKRCGFYWHERPADADEEEVVGVDP